MIPERTDSETHRTYGDVHSRHTRYAASLVSAARCEADVVEAEGLGEPGLAGGVGGGCIGTAEFHRSLSLHGLEQNRQRAAVRPVPRT